jgi:hypothetical protein
MADDVASGARRFLEGVSSSDRQQALSIFAACPTFEVDGVAPHFTDCGGVQAFSSYHELPRAHMGHYRGCVRSPCTRARDGG